MRCGRPDKANVRAAYSPRPSRSCEAVQAHVVASSFLINSLRARFSRARTRRRVLWSIRLLMALVGSALREPNAPGIGHARSGLRKRPTRLLILPSRVRRAVASEPPIRGERKFMTNANPHSQETKTPPEKHHRLEGTNPKLKYIGGSNYDVWNNIVANQALSSGWYGNKPDPERAHKQQSAMLGFLSGGRSRQGNGSRLLRRFDRQARPRADAAGFWWCLPSLRARRARVEHLHETTEGLRVYIAQSKTDQEAEGVTIAIARGSSATCPV
ncbi:hypothetical protein ACVWZV_004445 [Bradyrhizobium sp. GM5.1]